jgi:hypothetical protein
MKTVARIIERLGGLHQRAAQSIRLEVNGLMLLCIASLGAGPRGLPMVSVMHSIEQNGDLLSRYMATGPAARGVSFWLSLHSAAKGGL